AFGAHLARDLVGRTLANAAVQVWTDGGVAMVGEASGEFLVELVPAGQVVDDDDAGEGPVAGGLGDVRGDLITIGARDLDWTSGHALGRRRVERIPHTLKMVLGG